MKKTLLTLMASLLLGGAAVAQHYTAPNAHSKSSNTPIVAAVTVDGAAAATGAELAVYVDDELRGLATTDQLVDGKFWVQVYYNTEKPSDTDPTTNVPNIEDLTFKLWDPTGEGTELTDYTLTYDNNGTTLDALTTSEEGWGTPGNPVAIDFATVQMMTQTVQFPQGWSWWSSYVDLDPAQALTLLENGLGDSGLSILYQNEYTENYYPYTGYSYWYGNMTGIEVEKGYTIHTSNPVNNLTMTGTRVNLGNHPITIAQGWNWIGYPVSSAQSINSAFSNFTPFANDFIMGQGTSSTYYEGYGWYPEINLEPNKAYLYQSQAPASKQLVYSSGSRNYLASEEDMPHNWKSNPYAYPYNAAVIATVFIDGEEQRSENIEIGAFVDGECRGSAILRYFEPLNKYFTILTITGQDNDFVDFALFNHGQELTSSNNHIVLKKNFVTGTLDNPYKLCFSSKDEMATKAILFPNPIECMQSFSISIPENETIKDLYITNALGNILRHSTGAISSTNIQGLSSSGVYIIKVVCNSGNTYFDKLIVK